MKLVIDIDDEMVCNDIRNKALEPTSATDEVIICALYNGTPYEERPKGKWIFSGVEHTDDNPIDSDSYYCSVCKRSISTTLTRPTDLFPFCHCGADMRGDV